MPSRIYRQLMQIALLLLFSCSPSRETASPSVPTIIAPRVRSETPEKSNPEGLEPGNVEKIPEEAGAPPIFDLESEEARKLRALAGDPSLPERLRQPISLELLLCLAHERNPELEERRREKLSVEERYSQSRFLQEISEQYLSFASSLEINTGPRLHRKEVMQIAPFPASLQLMGEVVSAEVALSKTQYLMAWRDLVHQITSDFWELWFVERAQSIYREHLEILGAIEYSAREKYKAGLAPYSDVLRAEIACAQAKADVETWRDARANMGVRLLSALNLPPSISLGSADVPGEFQAMPASIENLYLLARRNRQEIRLAELERETMLHLIDLMDDELYPDFTLGLSYLEIKSMVSKMPFPETPSGKSDVWFSQKESYLREMRLQAAALEKAIENWGQKTDAEVANIYRELQSANRYANLYSKDLIPLAEENLRVASIAYAGNSESVDFPQVLEAQRILLEFQFDLHRNHKEYAQRLANLEKIAGAEVR